MTQSTSSRWKLLSPRGLSPGFSGFCLGLLVLHFVHSWIAAFGVGAASRAAAVCCLGCGIVCSLRWGRAVRGAIPTGGSWILLVALGGVVPILSQFSNLVMRSLPASWLATTAGQCLALLPGGLLMISLPTLLFVSERSAGGASKAHDGGIAGGLGLGWWLLLPWWGPLVTSGLAAGTLCVLAWIELRREPNPAHSDSAAATPDKSSRGRLLGMVLPLGLGFLWPVVSHIVGAWTLPSVWVLDARITAIAIGLVLATHWSSPFRWIRERSLELSLIALVLSVAVLAGGQEVWLNYALTLHSNVTQPWLLTLGRFLFVGLFPLVFGIAWGVWRTTRNSEVSLAIGTLMGVAGWLLAVVCLAQGIAPQWLMGLGIGLMGTSAALSAFVDSEQVKIFARIRRPAALATLTGLACLAISQHSSILPARLMYSGSTLAQHRNGTDWELLPYLDEGRVVSVTHGVSGTWVELDYRGLESFFHRDGFPTGYVSHDNRVMPDSPADLMLTTLPIVMHESPASICFLGWGTGIPVATALDFPVQRIDCFERDGRLPRLTFSPETSPRLGLNPFQDDRVQIEALPPELAVRAMRNTYDVIISHPVRSEEMLSVAEFTREFYQACADRLNADGLFCQRFQHIDHGPEAVIDVIRTLKSAFRHVAMVDTSPGETLFFATRARALDTTEFLVEGLQRTHVRRILARCGWDWAHVLKLPSIGSEPLDRLLSEAGGLPNSVLNHAVAVTHPPDAMRWSNKWDEKIERLSPFKRRFVDLAGEPGRQADVARRMEEIGSQRFVMTQVTDKPWAYRASIKELLQTKPRAKLIQTKGEKPRNEMHPVDRHRVDYLKTLSLAYREQAPSAEKIHDLTAFLEPYDPLISYFLHHEAAELYSRNPELDPRAEYLHLLNTIYFADSHDRSVHNVIRAIQLVHQHPGIVDSDRARFDQLNGLLQTLTKRWQLRQGNSPDSTDAGLTDVRDSIDAAEAGIEDLRTLADASGYGAEAWAKRERILEQMLVRPLRGYRGKLLPYHEKNLRKKAASNERDPQLSEIGEVDQAIQTPVN